jgi:CheY-like chemotaxis protein
MRVLFVDDDAMNRRVMKHLLATASVEMYEAPEAETGLSMIADHQYHLVLMDLRMPGMDGLTAIRQIRARADEKAELPILVVTADNDRDLPERCREAGADDLVLKPVSLKPLLEAIARVLMKRGGQSAVLA